MIKKRATEGSVRRFRSHQYLRDAPFSLESTTKNHTQFNLAKYHSFADIIHFLNSLATTFPDRVSIKSIGTTHEERQIPLIKVIFDLLYNILNTNISDQFNKILINDKFNKILKLFFRLVLIEKMSSNLLFGLMVEFMRENGFHLLQFFILYIK